MSRFVAAAAAVQFLVLSVAALPAAGQERFGQTGFRLGVATEYLVGKFSGDEEVKNGIGVLLHTDFRLSGDWSFRLSFNAGGERAWFPAASATSYQTRVSV